MILNNQLSNNLKKGGFFARIIDPDGESETRNFAQDQALVLQISRNKQYYNHLSPNRNFRLYQEGCLGLQSERAKFRSQEYSFTIRSEAIKKVGALVENFAKVFEIAEGHWENLDSFVSMNMYKLEQENAWRRQLTTVNKTEAHNMRAMRTSSLPFRL